MTDRLAELRRQRSLISEHLSWLEREIDQIEREKARPTAPPPSPTAVTAPASPATSGFKASLPSARAETSPLAAGTAAGPSSAVPISDPELLLEKFRAPPGAVKRDVRQGCLLYFVGALVLLGIGVAILYLTLGPR